MSLNDGLAVLPSACVLFENERARIAVAGAAALAVVTISYALN